MSRNNLVVSERNVVKDIGSGLENAFRDARRIDKEIARALNYGGGVLGYASRLPIVGRLVTFARSIKPLPALESELRTALNNSLTSLVKVGKKANEERERIARLEEITKVAIEENWGAEQFINFIEANTEISYTVKVDGEEVDMKQLFKEVDSRLSPERRKEKAREYMDWIEQHTNLSKQYLDAMHALCFVGCEWIGGMSRSYFDITELRGGMEEIDRTLKNIGRGGVASLTSQQAIRLYGAAYIRGMDELVEGYRRMCDLKDKGSEDFNVALERLKDKLDGHSPAQLEKPTTNTQGKILVRDSKRYRG